ncbi:MAG: DUF1016 N-terminal domain-containing protein [Planctomycetota bacterium]
MRNWVTGRYIVEYEQHGADRAEYGEGLLDKLAAALADSGIAEISARALRLYRQFFLAYPGIWQSAIAKSGGDIMPPPIWRSLIAKSGRRSGFREAMTPKLRMSRKPGSMAAR